MKRTEARAVEPGDPAKQSSVVPKNVSSFRDMEQLREKGKIYITVRL